MFVESSSEILLQNIMLAMDGMTFSKETAARIVGGEKKLMRLHQRGEVRLVKTSLSQNGKWYCNAADVLSHCRNMRKTKVKPKNKLK